MGRRRGRVGALVAVVAVSAAALGAVPVAYAAPGDLQLVPGARGAPGGAIAADGQTVAWTSRVQDAATGTTRRQAYARDLAAGTTVLLSATPSGAPGSGDSHVVSVSADGRLVAFTSSAPDLVADDTNGEVDVFVRDVATGTTSRVSVAADGAQATAASMDGYLSGDGRRVAFTSLADNLVADDTNRVRDVFVHDLADGSTRRVSLDPGGRQATRATRATSISADGRHVALVASWPSLTGTSAPHRITVFAHSLTSGRTERVSADRRGRTANGPSLGGALSADGRYSVFYSRASDLVRGDRDGDFDVFVRDRRRGRTQQLSVGRCAGPAFAAWHGAISDSGRYVAFAADDRGCVWDRRSDTHRRLPYRGGVITGDGRRMLLSTFRALVPEDSGRQRDLYVLDLR